MLILYSTIVLLTQSEDEAMARAVAASLADTSQQQQHQTVPAATLQPPSGQKYVLVHRHFTYQQWLYNLCSSYPVHMCLEELYYVRVSTA